MLGSGRHAFALNERCPDFALPGTDEKTHDLASFADRELLVVIVSCNHCPYVVAYEERIVALASEYGAQGVDYDRRQRERRDALSGRRHAADEGASLESEAFRFRTSATTRRAFVRALGARFTPEVFVFDRERKLRYHGRIDDNHRDAAQRAPRTTSETRSTRFSRERTRLSRKRAAFGCCVKWK